MSTQTQTLNKATGATSRLSFLETSVQYVRGVGPARSRQLEQLGISTVRDLIEYFPFRHQLIPRSVAIGSLTDGVVATLVGTMQRVRAYGRGGNKTLYAELVDGTGRCRVRWFHAAHLIDRMQSGLIVRLTGAVQVRSGLAGLTNPTVDIVDPREPLAGDCDRYEPVYSANAQVTSKQIGRLVAEVLDRAAPEVVDALPLTVRSRRRLPPLATAITRYHNPTNPADVALSRRRLAYDELLVSQLALQLARRIRMEQMSAAPIMIDERLDARIRKRIPFSLTRGQERAVGDIRADLARAIPMNRLVQGDVGCGKTAVAVYAALAAIARGQQVALLAPTEVLARQHESKIAQYLKGSRVRTAFVSGSSAAAKRSAALSALRNGELDLLIGTHAVLEKGVQFKSLGLAIIDEQQKFGVSQRFALRAKARSPHVLVLSATPIPRTLAMALLGDLDISIIDGLPPGRKPIATRMVTPADSAEAWKFIRSKIERGEQAFVVYPLVEESQAVELRAATTEMEALRTSHFSGFEVGLLHGRMKADAKAEVMRQFRQGRLRVLVSTVVIEVGVDVPSATIIAIEHADRFGLSQLHQLRGRVGRGVRESHCLLFTDTENEESLERLRVMCSTNDGFRIAEEDLRLRGPGELLGTRQHGTPAFKVADLTRDRELIEMARDDACDLLRDDPRLIDPKNQHLRSLLANRYGATLRLIQVA